MPDFPRPVPQIGWLGVTALATWVALAIANWRIALLVCGTFISFGLLDFWTDSVDLLLITGVSVFIAALIGMPLAVLYGTNPRARAVMTHVPRPDADDADLRLPDPGRAVLRHRPLGRRSCARWSTRSRP